MYGHSEHAIDRGTEQSRHPPVQSVRSGAVLQLALRIVLTVFIAATLLCEPPSRGLSICVAVSATYLFVIAWWSCWAFTRAGTATSARTVVALLMLGADVAAVSVLSVLTGLNSPEEWTSDVMRIGFFLIPLIAAGQLDPIISGVVAIPTLSVYIATCWITREANDEPWASILLSSTVLAGLAGGSVALSLIQRSRFEMIADLAEQRTQLLQELLAVEKHERQAISERLHDGALQCVLVARQDVEEVREGSTKAVDRLEVALIECSRLLRDVVRELHPDVLSRLGLKSAIAALADSISSRTGLTVDIDSRTWPDGLRTDADYLLYSTARETLTNIVKHAQASHAWIELELDDKRAVLRVADDGVGISEATVVRKAAEGHIGLPSMRAKALACGGQFDLRCTSPGTEITISVPMTATADLDLTAGGEKLVSSSQPTA
jgi:two-component system, NarL family, sensor kinase